MRVNETHFWSDLANAWWSNCNSIECKRVYDHFNDGVHYNTDENSSFKAAVSIDGYKKVRNKRTGETDKIPAIQGCICVGRVKLNGQRVRRRLFQVQCVVLLIEVNQKLKPIYIFLIPTSIVGLLSLPCTICSLLKLKKKLSNQPATTSIKLNPVTHPVNTSIL